MNVLIFLIFRDKSFVPRHGRYVCTPPEAASKQGLEDTLEPVAVILCTGGPDVIRKGPWSFYRTISGVRLCWELEQPKVLKDLQDLM